jgi:hypothetical protein
MLPPAAAQAPVVRREHGEFGDAAELVRFHRRGDAASGAFGLAHEASLLDLPGALHLQPVGRVVPCRIGLEGFRRPIDEFAFEPLLGEAHPVRAGNLDGPAAERNFSFVVERAQQFALPAGPDAGPHGLDVRNGENQEELQALHGLHHIRKGPDGGGVGEIAALGDGGHEQMVFDEPRRRIGFRRIEP